MLILLQADVKIVRSRKKHLIKYFSIFQILVYLTMDFLFKDRGSGKRAIKPSKEAEHLEALIPEHESDDSDFELEKHKDENSDHESDTDGGKSASGDSSSSDSDDSAASDNDSLNEDEVLRLKSNMTTQELISLAQRQDKVSTGSEVAVRVKVCGICLGSKRYETKLCCVYCFSHFPYYPTSLLTLKGNRDLHVC